MNPHSTTFDLDPEMALQSDLLDRYGFRHAFFTRRGGVSVGAFESLNLSPGVGDEPLHVTENLRRAAHRLALEPSRLCWVSQVHGNQVVRAVLSPGTQSAGQADGLWSDDPTLACCVRTADCIPVLVADPRSGRCAAVHAGWRGVVANVVGVAVDALTTQGSHPGDLVCAQGPHIGLDAFEIGPEVAAQLSSLPGGEAAVRWAAASRSGKAHADLAAIVSQQLVQRGIARQRIDCVSRCTFTQPKWFFSYRRDGRAGQHLSAICALPTGGETNSLPPSGEFQ